MQYMSMYSLYQFDLDPRTVHLAADHAHARKSQLIAAASESAHEEYASLCQDSRKSDLEVITVFF